MTSNISKNVELLEQFNNYKKFLDCLATPIEQEARRVKEAAKREKYDANEKQKLEHERQMQELNSLNRNRAGS